MRLLRAILPAALAALSAAAVAQYVPPADDQGGRGRARGNAQAGPATAVGLADLYRGVACQAEADAAALEAMLATPPYSTAEREAATRILPLIRTCLRASGRMTASSTLLRAVIAETLYETRFATAQAAAIPSVTAAPLLRVDQATTRADAANLASAYTMAECTAVRFPEPVRALLASDPATPAEQAAFTALNPSLGRCITGSPQLNIDLRTLRGVLAETLYRWSVVQRDGATSPYAAPAAAPANQ